MLYLFLDLICEHDHILSYLPSYPTTISVNPIIYGLVNPVFRKAYKNTLERFFLHLGCTTKKPVQIKTLHSRTVDANSKSTSSLDEVMTVQPGRKKRKKKRGPNNQLSVVSLISTHTTTSTHTATSLGSNSNLRSSSHLR